MLGEWSKSPLFKGAVLVVIVLVLLSFFWSGPDPAKEDLRFDALIKTATGQVAAEEAARVLGSAGGGVVLILPPVADEQKIQGTDAEEYANGFQNVAAKHASLRILGRSFLESESSFTFSTLRAAREKFDGVGLLVSFNGLPQGSSRDETEWLSSQPPKLIVLEERTQRAEAVSQALQKRVVQVVLVRKADIPYPEKRPRELQEIFDLFYRVDTAATPGVNN